MQGEHGYRRIIVEKVGLSFDRQSYIQRLHNDIMEKLNMAHLRVEGPALKLFFPQTGVPSSHITSALNFVWGELGEVPKLYVKAWVFLHILHLIYTYVFLKLQL